jgi:N-acetylglucosamine-6-phosphate deacetylase
MNLFASAVFVCAQKGSPIWLKDATLTISGGQIVGINRGDQNQPVLDTRAEGIRFLVPGFVDMHCHGGGGGSFPSGDAAQARTAAAFHAQHGSTSVIASLVTAPHEELVKSCLALAPLVSEGVIAGIHLEGPYLSALRCGAQDPRWLRDPNKQEIDELFAAAKGTIRQVTIAPELPGARAAIEQIMGHGAVVALGHTNANAQTVNEAIAAGARVATHLCNAMPPLHHREPTATLSMLRNPNIVCELIADGHHLSAPMFQTLTATAGLGRWALITDAIGATGQPDGTYHLGSQTVSLHNGVVRLTLSNSALDSNAAVPTSPPERTVPNSDRQAGSGALPSNAAGPTSSPERTVPTPDRQAGSGALAGSALTMERALQNAIAWGTEPSVAIQAASRVPARALGLHDSVGRLAVGSPADIVGLNERFEVQAVWKKGIRIR